jgi:putative ABC transport system permease protein
MVRIPLAWLQLTHEKLRLASALAGIAFAVILMLLQLGLMAALFDAAVLVYDRLRADLVLVNPQFEYIAVSKSVPRQRLYQALGVENVESVAPVYLGMAAWKNPVNHIETSLLVIGFDPAGSTFDIPEVEARRQELTKPDVILFDTASHQKFGPIAQMLKENPNLSVEINRRKMRIGGLLRMGPGFAAVGNVVTSELNFLRLFPNRTQDMIDVGLIRLRAGANAKQVQAQLAGLLPKDVRVLTRAEFMETEKGFWNAVSPVGFIFGMGVLMGFVVGSVIVYQILYTDVSDHLAEYATLKAMGYGDSYLFGVVFKEALLLSVLGYIPGLAISQGLYVITAQNTGLPIAMTIERAFMVFIFTIIMCCVSGSLAMRRIRSADPAEVF